MDAHTVLHPCWSRVGQCECVCGCVRVFVCMDVCVRLCVRPQYVRPKKPNILHFDNLPSLHSLSTDGAV